MIFLYLAGLIAAYLAGQYRGRQVEAALLGNLIKFRAKQSQEFKAVWDHLKTVEPSPDARKIQSYLEKTNGGSTPPTG